jgi:signal transduction histidine kinase
MFASLRNRMLVSYGLLIAVLICLFTAGSLLALLRNPLVYENAAKKLRSGQLTAVQILGGSSIGKKSDYTSLASRIEEQTNLRAVFLTPDGQVLADSQSTLSKGLKVQPIRLDNLLQRNEIGFLRDQNQRIWLVLVQQTSDRTLLLLAIKRPRLGVLEFFSSELVQPAILSALVGLILAIVIALGMTRWIIQPIRRIDQATRQVANGKFDPIPLEGPTEVRELADSFNRMSDQVLAAQQSQRDLVGNVSHELKTPLTTIQGFTQAIIDGVIQSPQDTHQTVELIHSEAGRMNRLVQELVALARLESGHPLDLAEVDLAALLTHIAERFQIQAVEAGLQLNTEIPVLPPIRGDADRLAQVFSNLIDNAIKYTPAGGGVRVGAGLSAGKVWISVADSGPGIPAADKERVFERFYRSPQTRSTAGQSSVGLGLAITRQIVQAHGGAIRVEDVHPHGANFIVDLPTLK